MIIRYPWSVRGTYLAEEASQTNLAVQVGETKANLENVEEKIDETAQKTEDTAERLKWTQEDVDRMWREIWELREKVNAHDVALKEILDVEVDEHDDAGDKSGAEEMKDAQKTVDSTAKTKIAGPPEGTHTTPEEKKGVTFLF